MPDYKTMPEKWVRKALYELLDGMVVNGVPVKVFDFRITVDEAPQAYILITGQASVPQKGTKCAYDYLTTIQLEVITQYPASGNTGSRLLNDDIADMVRASINVLPPLDPASGLKALTNSLDFGFAGVAKLSNYIVYRKPITASFYIV